MAATRKAAKDKKDILIIIFADSSIEEGISSIFTNLSISLKVESIFNLLKKFCYLILFIRCVVLFA